MVLEKIDNVELGWNQSKRNCLMRLSPMSYNAENKYGQKSVG